MAKVAINGFGRIGRGFLRAAYGRSDIDIVAINDLTTPENLAYLLKYDSVLGNLAQKVTYTDDSISIDGKTLHVFKAKDPALIDWPSVGAEIVVESIKVLDRNGELIEEGRVTKVLASQCGVPVVPWVSCARDVLERRAPWASDLVARVEQAFGWPVIVKPCNLGSSAGVLPASAGGLVAL